MSFSSRRPPEPLCRPQRSTSSFFHPLHAILTCLLILPLVVAHDKSAAKILDPVPATECKFPFKFNHVEYYGCTTAHDSKPWCIVHDVKQGQDWRYCSMNSFPSVQAFASGEQQKCATQGWKLADASVYGCAKNVGEKSFTCWVDSKNITCANLTPTKAGAMATGFLASGVAGVTKSTAGLVVAAIGGALVVALVAGLFVARRNSDSSKGAQPPLQSQWDYKGGDMHSPYGYASETGLLAPGSSMAGERMYTVISTYTPTLGDELEIQPGDKVSLLVEYDDGWCQGVNHSRGGTKGVFPKHCVDMNG